MLQVVSLSAAIYNAPILARRLRCTCNKALAASNFMCSLRLIQPVKSVSYSQAAIHKLQPFV